MINETSRRKKAYPANAPGEFYVEDQCCTLCGVPQVTAPELFSAIDDAADHCYVKRQPANEAELARMLRTISGAELRCIRYAGTEGSIQARLVESRDWDACDNLLESLKPRVQHLQSQSRGAPLFGFLEGFARPSIGGRVKRWVLRVLGRAG